MAAFGAAVWMLASMPGFVAYPIIVLIGLYLIVAGTWMLGELFHMGLVRTIRYSMAIIEFIDRRMSDGGVGIVGFFLLFGFFSNYSEQFTKASLRN